MRCSDFVLHRYLPVKPPEVTVVQQVLHFPTPIRALRSQLAAPCKPSSALRTHTPDAPKAAPKLHCTATGKGENCPVLTARLALTTTSKIKPTQSHLIAFHLD